MQIKLTLPIYTVILFLVIIATPSIVFSTQEDPITNGAETFKEKCASCHGEDAQGKEAASVGLKIDTPNLRKISARNNGQFPISRIYAIIDGREVLREHGTRAMPAWGGLFLSETIWEGCSQVDEIIVRGRIMELMLYLDSIQE